MENIWRFFDNTHCVGGIVYAESEAKAIYLTEKYLVGHFSDITNIESLDICVWKIANDDDYDKRFPNAVATSY